VCQSGPDVAAYPVLLPPTLGKHVEQNVSLATSSDARLRRPVRVTVLRRADVCAFEPGSAPRKHAPPKAMYPRRLMGARGFIAPPGQFRAGFSEQQQQFITVKSGVLQPIMPLDLPVKVRPWELTVYPRSHIRR